MSSDIVRILYAPEAEAYIQTLSEIDVREVGSTRWRQQHEYLEKLNMQAVASASQQEDEFVKEYFISFNKIQFLVHDLIVTDVWKQNVFSKFIDLNLDTDLHFPLYVVIYHEVTVINLLETILYHSDACEALDDHAVDLIDYCYRKLIALLAELMGDGDVYYDDKEMKDSSSFDNAMMITTLEELEHQRKKLNFDVCMKTISILRYVTDNFAQLPLSAVTRMLNTYDIPAVMIQLIHLSPWKRLKSGKRLQYVESKWVSVNEEEMNKLNKLEGQVWIALYQMLLSEIGQNKYEITSSRKTTMLRLRPVLNELLLSQMPVLSEMLRYLEQLSVIEPPPPKRELILEQMPEIWDGLVRKYEGKWKAIAKKQSETYFNVSDADMKETARRLAETYSNEVLEGLVAEPPKCVECGAEAVKRCSRCQNEWYCRRECQVKHWPKHKKACDLLYESLKSIEENEQNS